MRYATVLAASTLVSQASAAGGDYNFITNGADWPSIFPDCGLTNQSPIDLKTDENAYKTYDFRDDDFNKIYTNQVAKEGETGISIQWKGNSVTYVDVNRAGQDTQTFHSLIAESVFGANPRFTGVQFHFHTGSEHTVDGVRHDLEMHTVHLAHETLNNVGYAAMGLMFSTDKANAVSDEVVEVIDKFFDSMNMQPDSDPVVDEVTYGDLMMAVDMNNRWVYMGSVTTPPCAQSVYWNVLRTIYPIKQKHFDLFKDQLKRGDNDLYNTGNYRVIQPEDNHNVIVVSTESSVAGLVWLPILCVIMLIIVAALVYYACVINKEGSKK